MDSLSLIRPYCGTQPVWNEDGKAVATLHYTYYERKNVTDQSRRPLVISFNGGPGSASVWMHLAYTGPYVLQVDDEGYPIQPYGVKENPNSILGCRRYCLCKSSEYRVLSDSGQGNG